jgi:hypothetical protein
MTMSFYDKTGLAMLVEQIIRTRDSSPVALLWSVAVHR